MVKCVGCVQQAVWRTGWQDIVTSAKNYLLGIGQRVDRSLKSFR